MIVTFTVNAVILMYLCLFGREGVVNGYRHLSLLGEVRSGSLVSLVLHLIGLRWGSLNELEIHLLD